MDVAVPANMRVGLRQEEMARRGWALPVTEAIALCGRDGVAIIDLRERGERDKQVSSPAHCMRLTHICRRTSVLAACCMNWRRRPASASCSIAPSVSARQWRCRQHRTRASKLLAISKVAWRPGRKPRARWRSYHLWRHECPCRQWDGPVVLAVCRTW
jgi:hypothetical protein